MPEPGFIELTIDVIGTQGFDRMMAGRIRAIEDLRGFFETVAADWYQFETSVFAAQGAAEGLPGWAGLKQKYSRWKNRHYPGAGILVQSGALRDALTRRDAPDSIFSVSDDELRMGARRMTEDGRWDLGMIHQKGRADGSMVARPPLRLSKPLTSRWMRFLREHILGPYLR
jgi:hypothetical protein